MKYYGVKEIHTSLDGCMKELKTWMERPRKEEEKVHHLLVRSLDLWRS